MSVLHRRRTLLRVLVSLALAAVVAVACGAVQRPDGGEGLLPMGRPAPDVSGVDQNGKTIRLRDLAGKAVVVYFYPKDDTPGCTTEACAFRDAWDRYERAGIVVLGVSSDSKASHAEFAEEHSLPFSLVADEDGTWRAAFGVGSFLGLASRVSFLVGPDQKIARVYPDVDPGVHATETLADARRLGFTRAGE